MIRRPLISIVLILVFHSASAQVMNVRKWRKSERDSLDNALLFYEENYYVRALPIFGTLLEHHPKEDFLKYSYGKCALYQQDKHADAWKNLSEIYQKNRKVPDIQFDMALAAHYNNQFDEALKYVTMYAASRKTGAEGRKNAALLKQYITNAVHYYSVPTAARISNLGKTINSAGDEFCPVITADESVLWFGYSGDKCLGGLQNINGDDLNSGYQPDIYSATRKKGDFADPAPIDSLCTTWGEQVVSATPDGNTIFIYRDMLDDHGDLYWSFKTRDGYSKPKKLKGMVNTYSTEDHCSLSPDGKTLYFTSDRSGGYGDKDIYRASLAEDSTWVNVKNLGDSVNTIYDDDAPFMHADGVTLYFSSRGRTSMGGYDIFRASMESDSTFKQSRNMEMPVNSTTDDRYFVLAANGARGYLSRGDEKGFGKSDILVAGNLGVKPSLAVLRGRTTFNGKPVVADVKITVTSRGNTLFNIYHSDAATGNYLAALPPGQEYLVTYSYRRMPRHTFKFNGLQSGTYTEKTHDVNFKEDTLPAPLPVAAHKPVGADHPAIVAAPSAKETFVPHNAMQTKTMRYLAQYGDLSKPGLEFRVQLAAMKSANKYIPLPGKKLGRIEKVTFGDGYTRLTAGGAFTTLRKAFEHNKRVARAGQHDAFVIVIYKGKRVQLEDIEGLR